MILDPKQWTIADRPGYMGNARDSLVDKWSKQYGALNWAIGYEWAGQLVTRDLAIQIYEDAYVSFFETNPKKLQWLVETASDVFDTAPTNVKSGLDYSVQETPNNHIHDISIRRAVLRNGTWFKGNELVEVRWVGTTGYELNPGVVPFHKPELIHDGEIKNASGKNIWWQPKTIEDFYQRNKLLLVKKD